MLVYDLPENDMYSWAEDRGHFRALNFGQFMTKNSFNLIQRYILKPSDDLSTDDQDELITQLIEATNRKFFNAITPDHVQVLDERMIKSYHRGLKGKIIIRKPSPIGNEIKYVFEDTSTSMWWPCPKGNRRHKE